MDPTLASYLDDLHHSGRRHDAPLDDRLQRLRNMTREAAALIATLIRAHGSARVLEIGTSNGYSAIWFADAVRDTGGRLETVEIDPLRAADARANIAGAGLSAHASVLEADAAAVLAGLPDASVDFVVLDAERPAYTAYWPALTRVLTARGVIAVDNAISHAVELDPLTALAEADGGFALALHPLGDGVLTAVRGVRSIPAPATA